MGINQQGLWETWRWETLLAMHSLASQQQMTALLCADKMKSPANNRLGVKPFLSEGYIATWLKASFVVKFYLSFDTKVQTSFLS